MADLKRRLPPNQSSKSNSQPIIAADPVAEKMMKGADSNESTGEQQEGVLELILKSLKVHTQSEVQRMAFEIDPQNKQGGFANLYRIKQNLTPDHILKKITGPQGDELVCQIIQARSNIIAAFGRPRTSRFDTGFEFQLMNAALIPKDDNVHANKIKKEIEQAKEVLWNCGYKGLEEDFPPNLSQTLKMLTRDGLRFGRFAIEWILQPDKDNPSKRKVHSFRAVDAGTIYRIMPHAQNDQKTRQEALRMLQELKNERFDPERYKKDEYKWVQVIEGRIIQAFTDEELTVYNLYPVTDVEYNGYPITPIDMALNAIITHVNITLHNKLYFQHGRAARGMLTFKSDNVDEAAVQKIRLQFHQTINSVTNSWRMPVFGIGTEEEITWQAIDQGGRDAEFQYLSDNNARVILSAFQMSPEELPGYAHLARGTNTQALSESNNEWKLTAARDVGLRPLLYDIQDFLNTHVLPKFFESLSKSHQLILAGLDKEDPEKESTRIQQDMGIHMSYNDILQVVEKDKIDKALGGEYPLNPQFQQIINRFLTIGEQMENFMGIKGAAADPRHNWYADPLWLQAQQLVMQKVQMAMQQQMMAQQAAMQQQQGMIQQGEDEAQTGAPPPPPEKTGNSEEDAKKHEEWIKMNGEYLAKTVKDNHSRLSRMILRRHQEITERRLQEWVNNSQKAVDKIEAAIRGKKSEN